MVAQLASNNVVLLLLFVCRGQATPFHLKWLSVHLQQLLGGAGLLATGDEPLGNAGTMARHGTWPGPMTHGCHWGRQTVSEQGGADCHRLSRLPSSLPRRAKHTAPAVQTSAVTNAPPPPPHGPVVNPLFPDWCVNGNAFKALQPNCPLQQKES